MKIRKKNELYKKEVVRCSKAIILALFLVTSIFFTGIPTGNADNGSRVPKNIWGYITYCSGGAVVGGSVTVQAQGSVTNPTKTTTTGSDGGYLVDISNDPNGPPWPDGTAFTVTVTKTGWSGSNTGTVTGTYTQCNVVINPPTLVADASANPTTVVVGETVSFTGSVTGGAAPYTWDWNFGDGTTHSNLQNPTHSI